MIHISEFAPKVARCAPSLHYRPIDLAAAAATSERIAFQTDAASSLSLSRLSLSLRAA